MSSEIKVDTISEKTSANGVTIDGLTIKDGNILGDVALAGTTPTFTIGDAGAEDAALIFDGNQVDFVMGVDDSADEFRLGIGTTLGSTRVLEINSSGDTIFQKSVQFAGSTPTVTVGDGGAEDTKIVFDGNAVDYYVGLDDSADNLIIGSGSTVGSNSLITIDSSGNRVGIGTTSPSSKLDVRGTGTVTLNVGSTDGTTSRLTLDATNGDASGGDFPLLVSDGTSLEIEANNSGSNAFMTFSTNTSEKMRITSDGNVGIGESSPLGKLHVKTADSGASAHQSADELVIEGSANAGINILSGNSNEGGIYFGDDGDNDIGRVRYDHSANSLDFFANASERMTIDSSGNVGIGQTSPKEKLDVLGAGVFTGNHATSTNAYGAAQGVMIHATGSTGFVTAVSNGSNDVDLQLRALNGGSANVNQLVLDSEGNIGVGTSSPEQPLHIKSTAGVRIERFQAGSGGANIDIRKSRNATVGSHTVLQDGDGIGGLIFRGSDGAEYENAAAILSFIDGTPGTNDMPGMLTFSTTADGANSYTERMRIASTGNVAIGNTDTTPAFGVTVADTRVTSGTCLDVHHTKTDTTFSGIVGRFQSARNTSDPDDYEFIRCAISGVANKLFVHATGTVDNATGSYGTISDERIKQNIVDANSQWDDIKALKFKNFKKKANVRDFGDDALKELGVIAQDLEAAGMNGLVQELKPDPSHIYSDSSFGTVWTADDPETQDFVLFTADDEEVKEGNAQIGDIKKQSSETIGEVKEVKAKVKTVKYSILYMKAVKALQEAMARIETLETKVKALEDA